MQPRRAPKLDSAPPTRLVISSFAQLFVIDTAMRAVQIVGTTPSPMLTHGAGSTQAHGNPKVSGRGRSR